MAKIEDLISQIPDERLRKAIGAEVKALKKTKKFGLVFEEHLPETVRLPRLPVIVGELVSLKRQTGNQLWRVKSIHKGVAGCDLAVEGYALPKDILEPHDDTRADTWAKAKGLAVFADEHGMDFGRLIIGRKKGSQLQVVDMNDPATREKARNMQSQNDFESLFV